MRETPGSYRGALHVIAGIMAVLTLLPILVPPPRSRHGPKQNSIVPSPERGRCDRLASGNSKSSTRAVAGE